MEWNAEAILVGQRTHWLQEKCSKETRNLHSGRPMFIFFCNRRNVAIE